MSERSSRADVVERRGELLAELLLEELGAGFVARVPAELGYDFFVGFRNSDGGLNLAAVQVQSTDRPVRSIHPVRQPLYRCLANSNVPVLLLVADVKENQLFYALPGAHPSGGDPDAEMVPIALTPIDDRTKGELRDQLASSPAAASASVR